MKRYAHVWFKLTLLIPLLLAMITVSRDVHSSLDTVVPDVPTGASDLYLPFVSAPPPQPKVISLISTTSAGNQANYHSRFPALSANGRYIVFHSRATNLVDGDINLSSDIFFHDWHTGETRRVSVASDGTQGNGYSYFPDISADGRYVAFGSYASNLVIGDNSMDDVFVHDLQTGQTTLISVPFTGSEGNGISGSASISGDGRYVAYGSEADNLISDDTNGFEDIFVRDRQTGQTELVSVASNGTQGNDSSIYPSISADGRYVTFSSFASNLVAGDTNNDGDIFVHDRETGVTSRVSISSSGVQGNDPSAAASISADGRFVTFESMASNLVSGDTNGTWDVFVHDRQTGQTSRVSVASGGAQGNGSSGAGSISDDGRYVTFTSDASNLVAGDSNFWEDVFVHDRQTGQTSRISVSASGIQGNESSGFGIPAISADGRFVAFDSDATNLVSGDTNGWGDIFLYYLGE